MFGRHTQSQTKPTALGTQLQSSVYGQAIKNIYGCELVPPQVTWAQNLRVGNSGKKGKKTKKGAPPNYVENLDLLLGSNPIAGVLQMWSNNTNKYGLDFAVQRSPISAFGDTIAISDAAFYFVIAVTAEVVLSQSFDDYGANGESSFSGTYEYPLWNVNYHGPDLIQDAASRWFPFVYKWAPADGNNITLPQWAALTAGSWGIPNGNGFVNIYYAKLNRSTHGDTPLGFNRFTFEPELADGPEYGTAYAAQQIIMPFYAGIGSPNADLGASAMIPNWRIEVLGSFPRWPRGDADYADMFEDVVKSGMIQTGTAIGAIHRGVNLNELPGAVQKNYWQEGEFFQSQHATYHQPQKAGALLITAARARPTGTSTLACIDTAGDSFTQVHAADTKAVWYAFSVGSPAGNAVTVSYDGGPQYNHDEFALELDPASDTIAATASLDGSNSAPTLSIAVDGPAYLFAALFCDSNPGGVPAPPTHWNDLFPTAVPSWSRCMYRIVNSKGAYTMKFPGISGNWTLVIIAVTQSQPPTYAKTLKNIIDDDSMNLARKSAQAYGLFGSIALDSQKKAAEWMTEFLNGMNCAPVWSGFSLKVIPWSEVSFVGNGAIYTSPTSSGPVFDLGLDDFVSDPGNPPVTYERKAPVNRPNILKIQHFNRVADYAVTVTSEPQAGAIAKFGPRPAQPVLMNSVHDVGVARKLLRALTNVETMISKTYKFRLRAAFMPLEAMDLVTLTEPQLGLNKKAVRLTSVVEDDQQTLTCEAEEFIYGSHSPVELPTTTANPYAPNAQADPGSVNTPIFVEVPPRMSVSGKPELWIPISSPSAVYGGALGYVSSNGGSNYLSLGDNGVARGNGTTGFTTATWPSAVDPDTTNDLPVDLTESIGMLDEFSVSDEDNFNDISYVSADVAPSPKFGFANTNYAGIEPSQCVGFVCPPTTGSIWEAVLNAGGTGYSVGELFTVDSMTGVGAFGKVTSVSGGGVVTGIAMLRGGENYAVGTNVSTTAAGAGTGLTIDIIFNINGDIGLTVCRTRGTSLALFLTGPGMTGVTRFRPSSSSCGDPDTSFVISHPEPFCACGTVADLQPVLPAVPQTFQYDFENCSVTFLAGGQPRAYSQMGFANGNTVRGTLNEVVFDGSTMGGVATETFGGQLLMVEIPPIFPGKPSYYIAFMSGVFGYGNAPTGWDAVVKPITGAIQVFGRTGTASQPPDSVYELMSYATVNNTSPFNFTMKATGGGTNHLRRSVYGVPVPGTGVDHTNGARYAFLGAAQRPAEGVMVLQIDPNWIGKTLFWKFTAFNNLGGGLQPLADATPYQYTIAGIFGGSSSPTPNSQGYSISPTNPLSQTNATTVHMAKVTATFATNQAVYNQRDFTIPDSGTNVVTYYVTIYDPSFLGDTGDQTNLNAFIDSNDSRVGQPGYIYMGSIATVGTGGTGGGGSTSGGFPVPTVTTITVNGT
jgi:hypothetical protein